MPEKNEIADEDIRRLFPSEAAEQLVKFLRDNGWSFDLNRMVWTRPKSD